MVSYFFDTSALIKRYITEAGTAQVRLMTQQSSGNRTFVAQVTPIELASALARRERESTISARTRRAARLRIDRHMRRDYVILQLTQPVTQYAMSLVEMHPLRAYDSMQLATALDLRDQLAAVRIAAPVFVSADKRLLAIATVVGLPVEEPK
jgi:uncharacterized protein